MAEQLSATEELQLGLSRALYGVARVLRLGKLRDLLSSALLGPDATVYLLGRRYCCPPHATEAQQEEVGASVLSYRTGQAIHATQQHRRLVTASLRRRRRCPVGCRQASAAAFPSVQALARMLLHFHSIPWMTYRTGFTPIAVGDVQLRSDAGWGCTLRRWGTTDEG